MCFRGCMRGCREGCGVEDVLALWVDALCISQADDQETGHQVMHVGKVYENAASVLVWLGPCLEDIAEDWFRLV